MLDDAGVLDMSHNWIKPGWVQSFGGTSGTLNGDGTMVEGADPGFVNEAAQEFALAAGSPNVSAGTTLAPAVVLSHEVARQYLKHQTDEARPADGALDIGAYEFFFGGNASPIAVAAADSNGGVAPLTVNFDGTGSSDPDGAIASYQWSFGDGETASGALASHLYDTPGSYTAALTVADDQGATDTDSVLITVEPPDGLSAPALSGSSSGKKASLTWTAVDGADGYYVQRGAKKRGRTTWTRIATLVGATTNYSDQPGRGNHSYRVQAFRNSPAETSDYSNEVKLRVR